MQIDDSNSDFNSILFSAVLSQHKMINERINCNFQSS